MGHVPSSTYRLQLHRGFTSDDASAIVGYLKSLGITHVYCSPNLQAAPGSMHGYDVVDHRKVNEELGGEDAHERFCARLGESGLGQVLDIVPNHMSLGAQNKYWWDVLENGTNSRYASFFDIDWNSAEEWLRDKVLVPILPEQYGRALSAGDVVLRRKGSRFTVEAAGQTFPVSPTSLVGNFSLAYPGYFSLAPKRLISEIFLAADFGRPRVIPLLRAWSMPALTRSRNLAHKKPQPDYGYTLKQTTSAKWPACTESLPYPFLAIAASPWHLPQVAGMLRG